jgi:hypothetical protein
MTNLQHSFSSLELFERCPKQYHHVRILKDVKDEDNEYSLAGTRDHKALEDRLLSGTVLPPHLAKHEDKCELLATSGVKLMAEQELALDKQFNPCGWWDKDVLLRVKADVTMYNGKSAALLDWKTGKRKPKPFQLELGALAQFKYYPEIERTNTAFLWLKEDASDKMLYTREQDEARIQKKFKEKADKVQEAADDGVWQAKPSYFNCTYCPAKKICSYSQARD